MVRRSPVWTGKHGDVLFHLQAKCNQMTQAWTIREHRKRLGLSQRKLAKRAGVSFRNLQMWEGFESCPTIESIARLAVALGVQPSAILTRAPRAEWWNRLPPERKPAMQQDNPDFMAGVRYVIDNLMTTEEALTHIEPVIPILQLRDALRQYPVGLRASDRDGWLLLPEDVEYLCRMMGWRYIIGVGSDPTTDAQSAPSPR